MHHLVRVIRRRIPNHGDVIAELSGIANGRFNAGVRDESDDDELVDALSCKSRSVLAKPLEHQCSEVTISPGLGTNSVRNSPPQAPYSKLLFRHANLWMGAIYVQLS